MSAGPIRAKQDDNILFVLRQNADEAKKTQQADRIPQRVVSRIFTGEPAHRFGADPAAFSLLGGGRPDDQRGEEKREHHAAGHGVLLHALTAHSANPYTKSLFR